MGWCSEGEKARWLGNSGRRKKIGGGGGGGGGITSLMSVRHEPDDTVSLQQFKKQKKGRWGNKKVEQTVHLTTEPWHTLPRRRFRVKTKPALF